MSTALETLRLRFGTVVKDSVDVLHVAAALESSGITDQTARTRYGSPDVFALAARLREGAEAGTAAPVRRSRRSAVAGVSAVGNGIVYLLPALAMPALLRLTGTEHTLLALVVGAAVGWVWAVVASWHAFTVLGAAGPDVAADDLCRSVRRGLVAAVLTGAVVSALGGPIVAAVVAGMITAAQLATTLLFFLRRRRVLVWVLLAQGAFGMSHLLAPQRVPAVLVLVVFGLATSGLLTAGGVWTSRTAAAQKVPGLAMVLLYALASVSFLLLPQALFLQQGGGLPLALAGLFLTMGYVEWRAGHVSAWLRDELARTSTMTRFRRRTSGRLGLEALVCAAVTAVAGAVLLHLFHRLGVLSPGVIVVTVATAALAAAYLVALVLANTGAWAWLTGAFAGGASVQALLTVPDRVPVSTAFVAATGILLAALLVGFICRPVNTFR